MVIRIDSWLFHRVKAGVNSIDLAIRNTLAQFPEIKLAILFGSAVEGRLHWASDIDLAVAADTALTVGIKFNLMGELASELGRPVDLVDLSSTSGPILGEILRGRIIVKEDPSLLSRLMRRVWHWEADIAPTWRANVKARNARIFGK